MQYGGGYDLMAGLYGQFNAVQFPCGNTGAQMGGWFRKPIESVDDLKGLRIRAAGYLGQIYAALGAVPQQIPGSDLYSALEPDLTIKLAPSGIGTGLEDPSVFTFKV